MIGAPTNIIALETTSNNQNVKWRHDAQTHTVSTLMYASQQGDLAKVRKLIKHKPTSLWDRDRTGKSSLHYCCSNCNLNAAQAADILVMAAPELVEARDDEGFTPLHLAVISGNLQLVNFFLANNADVYAVDNEKHTVVHWATVCGEVDALRAVLAAGAPLSTPDIHGGYPLHYAAQMCGNEKNAEISLQILQTLLTHKDVKIDVEDSDGRQPLLWAASAGSAKALLALIRAGADVEASDKDGLTALHCAASRGHTDCIDSLLTLCGTSPDIIDSNGCTALHYAVTLGHADATALLLLHGANPNQQDRKGRSPAHCGCAKGQLETVKMLAMHNGNLWLKNARGDYPLHEAAASGRRELVRWLLEMRPSQVNAKNNDGRTPLHVGVLNDNIDMCKILMDTGAEINAIFRTSKNILMTPLDCALQRGFKSTAKYLQLHGGLPANRLRDGAHTKSTSVNISVKNRTNSWNNSSSDSERENGDNNQNKVMYRRKLMTKSDRKRSTNALNTEKLGPETRKNSTDSSSKDISNSNQTNKKKTKGTINYYNEITINGKTEINIHQTKEFSLDDKTSVAHEIRQKSANSIQKSNKDTVETAEIQEKSREIEEKAIRPDAIKNEVKAPEIQKIPDIFEEKIVEKNESKIDFNTKIDDVSNEKNEQNQSQSNSSEDNLNSKNIVVEASVHNPPEIIENEKLLVESTEIVAQDTKIEKSHDQIDLNVKTEKINENNLEETGKEEGRSSEKNVEKKILDNLEIQENTINTLENDTEKIDNPEKDEPQKTDTKPGKIDEKNEIDQNQEDNPEKISIPKIADKPTDSNPEIKQTNQPEPNETETKPENQQKNQENTNKQQTQTKTPKKTQEKPEENPDYSSDSTENPTIKHKSFKILDEEIPEKFKHPEPKKSKIPTLKQKTSKKSHKNQSKSKTRHLKNQNQKFHRTDSTLSLPLPESDQNFSEDDPETESHSESEPVQSTRPSAIRRMKMKKKKNRNAQNLGSDYESSNLIDSGFEPSPRTSRIPKWKYINGKDLNMTSVTQSIQTNIRRFHMERKIFQHLLDLKRLQIRSGQHNEAVLVKRAIDAYNQSCTSTVGAGRYASDDYSFKSFEKFLYFALRKVQRKDYAKNLPEIADHPLSCSRSTNKCMHATHAYTGVPCAAYLPKINHHTIPKIGFNSTQCKPGTGPNMDTRKTVTLELCHDDEKQVISLPAERFDKNKRYYVTFTLKNNKDMDEHLNEHLHSKSD